MKKIQSTYIVLLTIFAVALTINSCESLELDLANDPNLLNPEQSNPDLFLNSIQIDFGKVVERFGAIGAQVTRIDYMNGRDYENAFSPADFNGLWSGSYQSTDATFTDQFGHNQTFNGILADVRALAPLVQTSDLFHHTAISNVIEAYIIVTLVDFFGEVPYSEALLLDGNLNPNVDSGDAIYEAALNLLDQAIINFELEPAREPSNDFFYGGNWENWIKLANTLKMKIYLQKHLVDSDAITKFKEIVATGDFIQSTDEDFQFSWGNNSIQPDNRHPRYANNYEADGGDEYMSNWLMNLMSTSDDPRMRYYFFRQANAVPGAEIAPNEETLSCSLETAPQHYIDGGFTFCNLDNGYWGRDHGDDDGIPPDGFLRTTFGVYPAAGRFDDNSFEGTQQGQGGGGAGITPIMLASWSDFMRAEVALLEMDFGTASTLLASALSKSILKTQSFASLDPSSNLTFEPDGTTVQSFISNRVAAFDNAASIDDRWNIVSEQYWVSLFGNGIDAYNYYRRTGYPTSLQPNVEPFPATGNFIRSFVYPADFITNNSSATQKPNQNVKVFWDNNPDSPTFPIAN